MKLEDCIKRIEKYMHSDDNHPRLVDVQNYDDMNTLCSHFRVGTTIFKSIEDYASPDKNPSEAALFNDLRNLSGCIFITGFTTFYKLLGEQKLNELLKKLVSFNSPNLHVIVLCYQCKKHLKFADVRYQNWIYFIEGTKSNKTDIVFLSPDMPKPNECIIATGVHEIATLIEKSSPTKLFVKTSKAKLSYKLSLINISEQTNAYSLLCEIDPITIKLLESYGNTEQWNYAYKTIQSKSSWTAYATQTFGSVCTLDLAIAKWNSFQSNEKWMYFILLKLFGTSNSWCLELAAKLSNSQNDLIKYIYQGILQLPHRNHDYWDCYNDRKYIIQQLGKSDVEISDFCEWVLSKGNEAIYYLTDISTQEINLIFKFLNDHHSEFSKENLINVLSHVYPELYQYLLPYDYKNDLFNKYFDDYKYQKVVNCVFPEFLTLVEEQAIKRDYNCLLPSCSEKTEAIDMSNTLVYFIDAMGVEYLAFIMEQCRKYNLMAFTTLCHCEIPSITSKNKDFVEVFEKSGAKFAKDRNGIKSLDDIKHHGEEDFDYTNNSLPTYIYRELQIIKEIIEKSHSKLQNEF